MPSVCQPELLFGGLSSENSLAIVPSDPANSRGEFRSLSAATHLTRWRVAGQSPVRAVDPAGLNNVSKVRLDGVSPPKGKANPQAPLAIQSCEAPALLPCRIQVTAERE